MRKNSTDCASPIDFTYLDQLLKATGSRGPDVVHAVIRVFLLNAPLDIAAIRQALQEGNTQAAAHRAHRLISGALHAGAHRLVAQLRLIERLLDHPHGPDGLDDLASGLELELTQARECLLGRYPAAV